MILSPRLNPYRVKLTEAALKFETDKEHFQDKKGQQQLAELREFVEKVNELSKLDKGKRETRLAELIDVAKDRLAESSNNLRLQILMASSESVEESCLFSRPIHFYGVFLINCTDGLSRYIELMKSNVKLLEDTLEYHKSRDERKYYSNIQERHNELKEYVAYAESRFHGAESFDQIVEDLDRLFPDGIFGN